MKCVDVTLISSQTVDLWSVMDTPGPLTVFAPVSAAFDNMREGQIDYLTGIKVLKIL